VINSIGIHSKSGLPTAPFS